MSVVRRQAVRRWMLVGLAVAAVCSLPAIVAAWPVAQAHADPVRLRDLVMASADKPYQGYAEARGELGLPDLPNLDDVVNLFGGSTRLRAWYASPEEWRVAQVSTTGEIDTYRRAGTTSVWDFERNILTETIGDPPVRLPRAGDLLPPELARRLLAGGTAGDRLSALPSRRVAGVTAPGLRLTPGDPDTTFGAINVWADPETGLPVRVEVAGRAGGPVFTTRFLDLTQHAPDAGVLVPASPETAGFAVTTGEGVVNALNGVANVPLPNRLGGRDRQTTPAGTRQVTGLGAYGTGLATFVVVALPGRIGGQSLQAAKEGGGAPVAIAGVEGYEMRTSLLTALIVRGIPNGQQRRRTYLLVGSVSPEALRAAADELIP